MSRENSDARILDSALTLVTTRGGADVTMADIAKAAGMSRQAVYLHFADRAELMLALVRHVHEKLGVAEQTRAVSEAETGVAAMRMWVSLQVRLNPLIWPVARAFEVVRRTDPAAEKGWQDRMAHRLETCRRIAARMHQEGILKQAVSLDAAADLLWSVASLRTWEDLVLERGWRPAQYEKRITRVLLSALTDGGKLMASSG